MILRGIKFGVIVTAACAAVSIPAAPAYGQSGHPSAKATAQLSRTHLFDSATASEGVWTELLTNSIKTPNGKCLVVNASLECGLYTQTEASSKGGKKDTSTAHASMQVKVTVDGQEAHPGPVVFARRTQQLSATLEGMIADCLAVDDNGNIILDEECVTPEQVELVLETRPTGLSTSSPAGQETWTDPVLSVLVCLLFGGVVAL